MGDRKGTKIVKNSALTIPKNHLFFGRPSPARSKLKKLVSQI